MSTFLFLLIYDVVNIKIKKRLVKIFKTCLIVLTIFVFSGNLKIGVARYMNRYILVKSVRNLTNEHKIELQNLVDECDLIYDKSLSKHIDQRDLKRALLCIDEDGNITAAAFFEEQTKAIYLDVLYVLSSERSKGYGKKLLSVLKNYANKKGLDKIELVVKKNNNIAINLYEKKNFVINKQISGDAISMVKYTDDDVLKLGKILYKAEQKSQHKSGHDFERYFEEENNILNLACSLLKNKKSFNENDINELNRYARSDSEKLPSNLKMFENKDALKKALQVVDAYNALKFQTKNLETAQNKEPVTLK